MMLKLKKAIRVFFPVQTSKQLLDIHRRILEQKEEFLPQIIHIETNNRCNGRCAFCAASVGKEMRPYSVMPDELIDKMLRELQGINYSNNLSFFNNNEPFLEPRIFNLVAKARSMLPGAYLALVTNGTLLDMEKVIRIFDSGLNSLKINDYRTSDKVARGEYSPNIKKIKDEIDKSMRFKAQIIGAEYAIKISIKLKCSDAVLGKRAGTAPNRQGIFKTLHKVCLRPFEMVTISPEGKVALCSNDLLFREPMGNVNTQDLMSIWRSPEYMRVRRELLEGNRSCKSTCSGCDHRGYSLLGMFVKYNLYPKTVFGKFKYGLIAQV